MTTDNYSFLDVAVHAMLCGSREGQIDHVWYGQSY